MANALTAYNPEYWSKRSQELLKKILVGMKIANFEEREILANGDKLHRPFSSDPYVVNYVKGTAVTVQDISATDESLDVDQSKISPVYIDDIDIKQNKYQTADQIIDRQTHMLGRTIDHKILSQVTSANLDVDDGNIGGTSGNPISLSSSNVMNTLTQLQVELAQNNVEKDRPWYVVLDPASIGVVQLSFIANGFNSADSTMKNGYVGDVLGFKVFESNALLSTLDINIATNPSEGDTVVVNGVTFTFNATPSGAGSVNIGANAGESVEFLTYAINGTGTVGTDYIALSAANRAKLANSQVTATDGTTKVTLTAAGKMTTSETFTASGDNIGIQTIKAISGRMGGIDAVVQMRPNVSARTANRLLGMDYLTHTLYGVKMFNEGAQRTCELNIQGAAATAVV